MRPTAGVGPGARRRLVVVGAGVHAATFVDSLADRDDVPDLDVVVLARDPGRLATIVDHIDARLRRARPGWTVAGSTDPGSALVGADAVLLALRIGGLTARALDERFPAEFGFVGDEGLGPGGIANAWRTVGPLGELADVIAAFAPAAFVVNLVAPLGITTRVLGDRGLDVVGACELPGVIARRLAGAAGADVVDRAGFGGLNHISWFWPVGGDATSLRNAAEAVGLVDRSTWDRFGGVPMPYWYRVVDPLAGERLGVRQPAGRAEHLVEITDAALSAMAAAPGVPVEALRSRPTPWFDEAVSPILAARFGGREFRGTLNVRNGDLWPALHPTAVVEVRASVTDTLVRAEPVIAAPAAIERAMVSAADLEDAVYAAAVHQDLALLESVVERLAAARASRADTPVAALVDAIAGARVA